MVTIPVQPAAPRTVVVDLTPVLPGGENGGAKSFALQLVRGLAAMQPHTSFILLTQAAAHEELATLDSANVRRLQVIGPAASSARARLFGAAGRALSRSPAWAKRRAARAGYWLHAKLKRGGSGGLLRRLRADLLFCPFTAPTFHESGIPTVCTLYDLQFRAYPQFFAVEDAVQRERAFAEASRVASHLAAISDHTREAAMRDGAARVSTVYMRIAGIHSEATADVGGVMARLGVASGKYFLYPANYWKHKNHEMLLAAFAMAIADGLPPGMRLVCTGAPGARERWLREAAARMGLDGRVVFAGFLPQGELHALLRECRGLVFPSLHEGFGLPVVEAMSAGVPVACSNVSALPEAAGDCALLFDPRVPSQVSAAILALAADEALRARLIEAGRGRAAEFADAERMASEYWGLFAQALAARGPTP